MSMIKYRIHEVAKDFNVTSKVISQILTDYIATPKNHMQVLETNELDVIFEYMTQHNQAESLEEIFKTPAKPVPAPAREPDKDSKPAAAQGKAAAPAAQKGPAPQPEAGEAQQAPHAPPGGGEARGGYQRRRRGQHREVQREV